MISFFFDSTLTRTRSLTSPLGRVVSTTSEPIRCRLETSNVRVAGQTGETERVEYVILVGYDTDLRIGDRITVTTTAGSWEWAVKDIRPMRGFGPSHLEVRV